MSRQKTVADHGHQPRHRRHRRGLVRDAAASAGPRRRRSRRRSRSWQNRTSSSKVGRRTMRTPACQTSATKSSGLPTRSPIFPAITGSTSAPSRRAPPASKCSGRPRKNIEMPVACNLFTKSAQSSGPENMGPERPLSGLLAPGPVLSFSRITLENNGKIQPQPDGENAFAGASGGEGGIRTHGRLAPSTVFETAPFDRSGTSPWARIRFSCAMLQEPSST